MAVVFVVLRWRATASRPGSPDRRGRSLPCTSRSASFSWIVLRPPPEARGWPLQMNLWEAFIDLITVSAWYQVPAVLAALAIVAGIVWACIARTPPAVVALGMYIVAGRALHRRSPRCRCSTLRDALTGMWYNNLPRLAALLPIAMVPLGAYGVACTWAKISSAARVRALTAPFAALGAAGRPESPLPSWRRSAMQTGPWTPVPMARAVGVVLVLPGAGLAAVSADEMALIDAHRRSRARGSRDRGQPLHRRVTRLRARRPAGADAARADGVHRRSEPRSTTGSPRREAGDEVCAALERLGVGFVLDFGDLRITDFAADLPGLGGSRGLRRRPPRRRAGRRAPVRGRRVRQLSRAGRAGPDD